MTISLDEQIRFMESEVQETKLLIDFDITHHQYMAILASLRLLKKIREGTQLLLGAIICVVLLVGFGEAVSILVSP